MIAYSIIGIISLLVAAYFLFTSYYPSFGAKFTTDSQKQYEVSEQFKNGKFENTEKIAEPDDMPFSQKMSLAYKFFTAKVKNSRPKEDLKVQKHDSTTISNYKGEARLIWYGHSSFLLQMEGKNILLDPMFGQVAAPHPLLGEKRFNSDFPLVADKLPEIDAVLFSHDHYDHLDYETIMDIKDKVKHFFVPLRVGAHLEAWGVPKENITELDWWQETTFEGLTFACTPSQHFSGRKMNTGQSTLWGSWVIQSANENIFFSGDSGYASHFKEIGEKYGPFDIALMECGQYNEMWSTIHMMPEETAQAGVDVQAKKIMPIHWGGFKLALHTWTDPIERVSIKAKSLNLDIVTPQIGEPIVIKDTINNSQQWWINL